MVSLSPLSLETYFLYGYSTKLNDFALLHGWPWPLTSLLAEELGTVLAHLMYACTFFSTLPVAGLHFEPPPPKKPFALKCIDQNIQLKRPAGATNVGYRQWTWLDCVFLPADSLSVNYTKNRIIFVYAHIGSLNTYKYIITRNVSIN